MAEPDSSQAGSPSEAPPAPRPENRKRRWPIFTVLSWLLPLMIFARFYVIADKVKAAAKGTGIWLAGLEWFLAGLLFAALAALYLAPLALLRREPWYGFAIVPLIAGIAGLTCFRHDNLSSLVDLVRSLDYRYLFRYRAEFP